MLRRTTTTYGCADGRYVAVGAIENRFYAELSPVWVCCRSELPDRAGPSELAGAAGQLFAGAFAAPHQGRVDGGVRRHRCLRHAGADLRGGRPIDPQLAARRHPAPADGGHLESAPAPRFSRSGRTCTACNDAHAALDDGRSREWARAGLMPGDAVAA